VSEHTAPLPGVPRTRLPGRILAGAVVAVVLAVGVLAFGRISDDANVAMAATAGWFGLVFAVAGAIALRRRELAYPLATGFGVVAIATAFLVVYPTLNDKEVNERVVTGTPARETPAGTGSDTREGAPRPTGNVQIAAGSFRSIAHSGTGKAAVVELPSGERKLTLTSFETDSGPDLRLYVSTGDPATGDLGEFEDLGALKGNKGNQQYTLSANVDLERYSTVVVWCRAFSVAFTSAALERS
jgi:Electron transfer DM13